MRRLASEQMALTTKLQTPTFPDALKVLGNVSSTCHSQFLKQGSEQLIAPPWFRHSLDFFGFGFVFSIHNFHRLCSPLLEISYGLLRGKLASSRI